MNYFQHFEYEIKTNIFKYTDFPSNLARTCRSWSVVVKDPYAKYEWLIVRYGKAHALFHAVRLGPTFIDIPVCQALIAKEVIISRYFIQRLLMHFGKYDQKLIEFKIEHSDAEKIKSPWASNLPISIFTYLLDIGYRQLSDVNEDLPSKGNDMELFHFLSADPHAPGMLRSNLNFIKYIEDLILIKRFIPFPPRPKAFQLDLNIDPHIHQQPIPEEYLSKDGYENNSKLNVIASVILVHPDLVNLWKQIGYHEICDDVNDLVMQGALLILFPLTPSSDWTCPTCDIVVSRLSELINLGFKLQDNVIIDALHMFEHRLDDIGNILWDAFITIRNSEHLRSLAFKFFREAFKPGRNLKKDDLLNFLKSKFDFHEQVVRHVIEQFFIREKVRDIVLRRKSLILSPKIYQYILDTYGNESKLASMCFKDILLLRVYIDTTQVPEMSTCTRESITSTFNLYVKANVKFKPKYMNLLSISSSMEIIKPFFDFLSSVFEMKPKVNKFSKMRKKPTDDKVLLKWVEELEQLDSLNKRNNGELSINFRKSFVNFLERLKEESPYQINLRPINNCQNEVINNL